jgi:apolipoprotein N-acyltransferase
LRKRRLELLLWAFLLSLAFYPKYFGFLAWTALVRPIMIFTSLSGREAFNAGYYFGFCFNLFCLYWVGIVSPPGMVAAVLILAVYYAVMISLFVRVYRINKLFGYVLLPFLWVGVEYFRTISEFAFPWNELGYTQSYYLYIAQIVSIISVHGLSLVIVAVNVLFCQVFRAGLQAEKRLTSGLVGSAVVLAMFLYGWVVMPPYPEPGRIKVGLLQGAVPIDVKWDQYNKQHSLNLYDSLTQTLSDSGVELFVWPETSAPCYLSFDGWCENIVGNIARKSQAHHLVGALGVDFGPADQYMAYNSCYQVGPDGKVGERYDKVKLVPFAERVPYQDKLPFLKAETLKKVLTFIETYNITWWSDFYGGNEMVLFEFNGKYYASIICFESTFPEYVRQNVQNGAEFLVGITNDTWFGTSVGIHMHSRIFLMRCIENRIWGARSANSGITYVVDGFGRIREELPVGAAGALSGKLGEYRGRSTFTDMGNIAGILSWLITVSIAGIFLAAWLVRRIFWRRPAHS